MTYAEAVNKTRVTLDVWGDMSGRIFDPHLITNDKVLGTQLIPEGFYTGKVTSWSPSRITLFRYADR